MSSTPTKEEMEAMRMQLAALKRQLAALKRQLEERDRQLEESARLWAEIERPRAAESERTEVLSADLRATTLQDPPAADAAARAQSGMDQIAKGRAPLSDTHLYNLQWASLDPNRLDNVWPLESDGLSSDGRKVAYVAPDDTVHEIVNGMLESVPASGDWSSWRKASRPYVSGPTGSGKSRLGWEVFQEMERRGPALGADVFWASINVFRDANLKDIDGFAASLVSQCARWRGERIEVFNRSELSLMHVLDAWGSSLARPALLVLHMDEVQSNARIVLTVQDQIEAFNFNTTTRLRVLPICTGLTNKEFLTQKNLDASTYSRPFYLGYLSNADGSPAHDKTWAIVRNAAHAALRRPALAGVDVRVDVELPEALSALPELLRFLVEDLAGWPMGAVQLGGQLASALKETDGCLTTVDFESCEQGLDEVLGHRYAGFASPVEVFRESLQPAGVFKLLVLILAPFPVPESEPVSGKTVGELQRFGFLHLEPTKETNNGKPLFFLRLSKPLLRFMNVAEKLEVFLDKTSIDKPTKDMLKEAFKTCRDYHGDQQEFVQLLSFVVTCAAYMLLTEPSRPPLESLAGLRPGSRVQAGDDDSRTLQCALDVLKKEAQDVDEATAEMGQKLQAALKDELEAIKQLEAACSPSDTSAESPTSSQDTKPLMMALSMKTAERQQASENYITARSAALALRKIHGRGGRIADTARYAGLSIAGEDGVDAFVSFGGKLYVNPRDSLLKYLGLVFGGIAARCGAPGE